MKKIASILILLALGLILSVSTALAQVEDPGTLVIRVKKSVSPPFVYEPGGQVHFTVTVANTGSVALTLTSLVDNIHGDLNGQGTCSVPQVLPPAWIYSCTFPAMVNGNAGYSETDTITATAVEPNGTPHQGSGSATVVVLDVPPVIAVSKTPNPAELNEPGGVVTFTVSVENHSVLTDPVTITSLVDDIHGNLNGQGTCSVPQTIAPDATYTCHFSATVTGSAGFSETDTVTATGHDDEGNPVSQQASATVHIVGKLFKIWMPFLVHNQPTECGELSSWFTTVGFEDLTSAIDYDYNDWITFINGTLDYSSFPDCKLNSVNFDMTPKARGARYEHAFHVRIPANIFSSNGTATLTLFDASHNVLSTTNLPFTAALDNDYTVFTQTSIIFPTTFNTIELSPYIPPTETAELTINFNTPITFDIGNYDLTDPHGVGLFFDPYLHVVNNGENIHTGSMMMLNVPIQDWRWPEERRAIYRVYPMVTFDPGPPVLLSFPASWWTSFNNCVYGDGVVCPLAYDLR